jgi:hypothetical protein
VTYNLGKVGISEGSVKAYRTTLAGNIEATHQDLQISSSSFVDAQQPGQSITTYVVSPSSSQSAATSVPGRGSTQGGQVPGRGSTPAGQVPDPCLLVTATDLTGMTGHSVQRDPRPSADRPNDSARSCYYSILGYSSPNGRVSGFSPAEVTAFRNRDPAKALDAYQLSPIGGIGDHAWLMTAPGNGGCGLYAGGIAVEKAGVTVIIEVDVGIAADGCWIPGTSGQLKLLASRAASRIH